MQACTIEFRGGPTSIASCRGTLPSCNCLLEVEAGTCGRSSRELIVQSASMDNDSEVVSFSSPPRVYIYIYIYVCMYVYVDVGMLPSRKSPTGRRIV